MIAYLNKLMMLLEKIQITNDQRERLKREKSFDEMVKKLDNCRISGHKIAVIGNGGSAAIAAHTVNDFLRNCETPALCFSEAAVLTCFSNDLGYEFVYEKQIQLLLQSEDILIAISSSGESENILKAVKEARKKNCYIITLSGFKEGNRLRNLGDINIYVPTEHYGHVEMNHQILLHYLTDKLKERGME